MKFLRVLIPLAGLLLLADGLLAQVHVSGYYRKDGTYVRPHMRSSPDGNPYNNWSFPGNTNPFTGKVATGNPETYLKNYYDRSGTSSAPSLSSSSYSFPGASASSYGDVDFPSSVSYPSDLEYNWNSTSNNSIWLNSSSYSRPVFTKTQRAINYNNQYSWSDRKIIEQALFLLGYDPLGVDGTIDEDTIDAIKAFQRRAGISVDGMVGPQTVRFLAWYLNK